MSSSLSSLIAVGCLAALHVAATRLRTDKIERPSWFSVAGGISVAYVLIYLLPELAENQHEWLVAWPDRPLRWLDRQVYVAATVGLVVGLGINYLTAERKQQSTGFWLNIPMAVVHNILVGALGLQFARPDLLAIAVVAFGSHFLVEDRSLQVHYGRAYEKYGRWLLAGALLVGWAIATVIEAHVIVVGALLGFLSGGIILSSIKEELPEKRQGRFGYFVFGAALYTTLLLVMSYLEHSK